MPTILIVDDEKNIRATLTRSLRLEGYGTVEAANGVQALERIAEDTIDLIILDLQMPILDGLAFLEKMASSGRRVPTLILTAHGTIEKAVRAVRLGALDFIEKPPAVERLLVAVANALKVERLETENRRLTAEAGLDGRILGDSSPMRELDGIIRKVAPTDAGVLLLGENGTGKELIARALHKASGRSGRAMVTVNCAAIPETLFESELFGHVRGAFTGAHQSRRGRFREADGGTLFLDEVGEIPIPMQPKMLRALETGEIERVGGTGQEKVDVRVIAATNRNLEEEVAAGHFRQDLYYRLLVVPVRVPPLRERVKDIPLLARHFLEDACRRNRIRPRQLADDALSELERHAWPGNVRELKNTMERVAILAVEPMVRSAHLQFLHGAYGIATGDRGRNVIVNDTPGGGASNAAATPDLAGQLRQHERHLVLAALERNRWRMAKTARELNLERSHLYKKMKALGIERPADD
ncbi:MAG: sigma-54 dependent transcriptional regulator [Acidobacteria bacterium]|nr:sigma-54 dependent transcriptional regulator [Acidobacteriota bacterium]